MKKSLPPRWLSVAARANDLHIQQAQARLLEARQEKQAAEQALQTHRHKVLQVHQDWHAQAQSTGFRAQELQALLAFDAAMRVHGQGLQAQSLEATDQYRRSREDLGGLQRQEKALGKRHKRWRLAERVGLALASYREAEQAWVSQNAAESPNLQPTLIPKSI
jgi:hypothetical protein